jgi:hypothetical protein
MRLDKYKKKTKERKHKVTSVNLEEKHLKFVQDNDLQLSSLIRAIIDELIEEQNREKEL